MSELSTGETIVEKQSQYSVTPTGRTLIRTFEGTREQIDALAITYGGASSISVGPGNGPMAQLTVEYAVDRQTGNESPTGNILSTEWHFDTQSAMVPITEHPNFLTQSALFFALNPARYRGEWEDFWTGKTGWNDLEGDFLADISGYSFMDATLDFRTRGVKGYFRGEPILQVVDRYQWQAPFGWDTADINIAYATDDLVAKLQNRYNPLPTHVAAKMRQGEWLCEHISDNTSSDGSRMVTQAFRWADAWDEDLYDHA